MDDLSSIGRALLVFGLMLAGVGGFLVLTGGLGLGRLPGDIAIRGERWSFYLPLGTSILISLALTLVLTLLGSAVGRR